MIRIIPSLPWRRHSCLPRRDSSRRQVFGLHRLPRFCWPAALLWPVLLGAQTQTQISGILERLDRLERENRALTEEVKALRAKLEGPEPDAAAPVPSVPTGAGTAAPAPVEDQLQVQERRIEEQAQSKVEASQRFPIRLTGMALFNAYENSRQSGGAEYPATASTPGQATAGATLRQTIIGLDFRGPTAVWGATVHGSVYMDFFPTATNGALRMRTGSIEMEWKSTSLMVGLEKPIFNPREPSSLAQVGVSPMTGTGNLWLWLPQVRLEHDVSFTRSTGLRAQAGVVQTREVSPYTGTAAGTLAPARPGLEGRFEFFHNFDDERRVEIAPGFHTSQTHFAGLSAPSSLFSLDWMANPWRRFEFSGAFYSGQNVAPLGNGYGQGFGVRYSELYPVDSQGGWAQLTIHTVPRLDFHFFSGQQDDRNRDLTAGRIGKNLMSGGNLYYRLAPNVILALEASQLRTFYLAEGLRINNHYDLALAYLF